MLLSKPLHQTPVTYFGTQIPPTMFNIKLNSSLKVFLTVLGLSFYLFLSLCWIATDNAILEWIVLSLSLFGAVWLVVAYFKDM